MVHVGGATALGSVIAAAEAASPVEAVESVTRELGRALEASEVSFLIVDLSGRALVRLAHVPLRSEAGGRPPRAQGERCDAEESATVVRFDGGPEEQAIRIQQVQVLGPEQQDGGAKRAGHWRVLAPVTERGEAIGLLELFCRASRARRRSPRSRSSRTCSPSWWSPTAAIPTFTSGVSAPGL